MLKALKRRMRRLKARLGLVYDWTVAARKLGGGWDERCNDCEHVLEPRERLYEDSAECALFGMSLDFDTEWIDEDCDGRRPRGGGFSVLGTIHNHEVCRACELEGIKRTLLFWKMSKEYTKYY